MIDALGPAYLWLKWLHIVAVISWMAGLLYLPRLFVYHVETSSVEVKAEYVEAERKLLKRIMNPAMIVTWIAGVLIALSPIVDLASDFWLHAKFVLVILMTAFHIRCSKVRRELESGTCEKSGRYFRFFNEVPTVLMIAIVGLVVLKPF